MTHSRWLALLQVIKLDHDFGTAVSGVLTDSQARVLALWGSYSEQAGSPSHSTTIASLPTCPIMPPPHDLIDGAMQLYGC